MADRTESKSEEKETPPPPPSQPLSTRTSLIPVPPLVPSATPSTTTTPRREGNIPRPSLPPPNQLPPFSSPSGVGIGTRIPPDDKEDDSIRGKAKNPASSASTTTTVRRPRPGGGGPPPPPSAILSSSVNESKSLPTTDNNNNVFLPGSSSSSSSSSSVPTESENNILLPGSISEEPLQQPLGPPLSARSTGTQSTTVQQQPPPRGRPQRPTDLPPPEAFGILPDGLSVAAPTMRPKERSRSRPHRPGELPPPEAFGELPEGMSIIGPSKELKGKPKPPLRAPPMGAPPTDITDTKENTEEVEAMLFDALTKQEQVVSTETVPETVEDVNARVLRELEAKRKADHDAIAEAEAKAKEEAEERNRLRRKKIASLGPAVPPSAPPKVVPIDTNLIPRGRIEITIERVIGIGPGTGGNNGKITATTTGSPYIVAELNLGKSRVTGKSSTYKNVLLSDFQPNSIDPPISLLVTEGIPAPVIPQDMPEEEKRSIPPLLHYSVWLSGSGFMSSEEIVAEGVIPAAGLFILPKGPKDFEGIKAAKEGIEIDLPLHGPRIKGNLPQTGVGVFAYIRAHVKFVPAKAGVLCITVHESRNLRENDGLRKISPYAELSLGTQKTRGATVQEGGINSVFNDEELYLWIDHATSIGTEAIKLRIWDGDAFMGSTYIGGTELSILPWSMDPDLHQEIIELNQKNGLSSGSVVVSHRFYPAGELTVKICEGKNLFTTDVGGGNDSYAILTLHGRVKTFTNRTAVDSVSGANPIWNETYVYDIVDQADLHIAVMDKDLLTKDDLIGEVTIDLAPVFQYGMRDAWIPIKKSTDWGGFEDRGNLRLEVDFWGPPGIAYPLIRGDKATFDEKERRSRRGPTAAAQEAAEKARTAMEEQIAKEREQAMKELMGGEFTDKEIQAAFDAIDIDKNLVINAAELRHVLTCMGEIITDKEIDTMLAICDTDGDGGVAFYEFYQMAKASNPGDKDWRPMQEADFHEKRSGIDPNKPKPPPVVVYDADGNPIDVIDAADDAEQRRKAMLRASEMARKGEKKRLCEELVEKLDMRLPELQRCFKRFRDMACFASGRATFDEMCQILDIETDNEFRDIYTVFSDISVGKVNVRELLLALNNFTGCTKPQRINFCFFLFDADQSGEIGAEELSQILQSSHLSADTEALKNKVLSVLHSADHDESGSISLEEFIVISNRFPNILFPTYNMTDEDALRGRSDISAGPVSKKFPTKVKKQQIQSSRSDIGAL